MIEVSVQSNIRDVASRLTRIEREQLPYATSRALTKTVFQLKSDTAPESMRKEMVAPVRYTLGGIRYKGATKTNLKASVYVENGRLKYLRHVATGKDREPITFPYVMVPIGLDRLGGRGRVINNRLARSYRAQLLAKDDHFEAQIRNTKGIWQRVGPPGVRGGQPRNIRLVVLYLPRTTYRQTWNFYQALAKRAGSIFSYELNDALLAALASAKPRGT